MNLSRFPRFTPAAELVVPRRIESRHLPRWLAAAVLSASLTATFTASADDQSATIAALLQRIEQLEKKVEQMESSAPSKPTATAAAGPLATPIADAARIS